MKRIRRIEQAALEKLANLGIKLRNFKRPINLSINGGERAFYNLPQHDEKDWFREYVKHCLEKGMNPKDVEKLTREAYGLLRFKQALAGSSDGSQLGALFAVSGHVLPDDAKQVYQSALVEFDSRVRQRVYDSRVRQSEREFMIHQMSQRV